MYTRLAVSAASEAVDDAILPRQRPRSCGRHPDHRRQTPAADRGKPNPEGVIAQGPTRDELERLLPRRPAKGSSPGRHLSSPVTGGWTRRITACLRYRRNEGKAEQTGSARGMGQLYQDDH